MGQALDQGAVERAPMLAPNFLAFCRLRVVDLLLQGIPHFVKLRLSGVLQRGLTGKVTGGISVVIRPLRQAFIRKLF